MGGAYRNYDYFFFLALTLGIGGSLACYLNRKDVYKKCIIYEEIMSDIVEESNEMFQALNIPLSFVPGAIKTLDTHSQKKMFDKNIKEVETITKEELKVADEIFKELDIPIKVEMTVQDLVSLFH